MLTCQICGYTHETIISVDHLRGEHGINVKEYHARFPGVRRMKGSDKRAAAISAAKKGKPAPNKGKPASEEQKAKQSAAMKGRASNRAGYVYTEEEKAQHSDRMKAHYAENPVTEETRTLIGAQVKARLANSDHPFLGKTHTQEAKLKMRESQITAKHKT